MRFRGFPLALALVLLSVGPACSDEDLAVDGGAADGSVDGSAPWDGALPDGGVADGGLFDGSAVDGDVPLPAVDDPCAEWGSVFPEEAVMVSPAQSADLQALLDTHGVIRLVAGADYRTDGPESVRLGDDQAILSLGRTLFPDVVVAAGTEGAKVRGLSRARIRFEAGEMSRSNCFMSMRLSRVEVDGASAERNLFIDFGQTTVDVDTSAGGVFRDNRFIKMNSHGSDFAVHLIGDEARSSGGNVFLLTDSQTPAGSPFFVSGQSEVTFVGVNAEAYNWRDTETEPYLFRVHNTGTFRGSYFVGTSRHGTAEYPMLDMDADAIYLHRTGSGLEAPQLRLGENVATLVSSQNGWDAAEDVDDRASGGLRLHLNEAQGQPPVTLNGVERREPLEGTESDEVHAVLSDERDGAPWPLPSFAPIPDATGADWEAAREGQPDERADIQAMLDSEDGVAQLEARIYYVGGPLVMGSGDRLIGAGMGETAIVALDPAIDLIHVEFGDPDSCAAMTGGFTVAELTLQGAASGIDSAFPGTQVNQAMLSHVVFRDMSVAGIHISGAYGWDNNFFDHLNFVDCAYGVLQEGLPRPDDTCYSIGEWSTMSYMDKTIFFRNQFVRCGEALVLRPTRANNLDGIVESRFADGEGRAIELASGNSGTMIAGCVFENNDADPVLSGRTPLVNSYFIADRGASMVGPGADVEGCTFRRGTSSDATIFGNIVPGDVRNINYVNISNSDSDMPIGAVEETIPIGGLYINNALPAGQLLGDFMSVLDYQAHGTPPSSDDTREVYTVVTGEASPGSQLLFQRAE